MDNKPTSMSMKDYLIRVQSVKMMMGEKLIETIVNHQFTSMAQAMRTNNSIELSGFGKFYFNTKKAKKRLDNLISKKSYLEGVLENDNLDENKKKRTLSHLASSIEEIAYLKSKTNELQSDLRGMEEQADSIETFEGTD